MDHTERVREAPSVHRHERRAFGRLLRRKELLPRVGISTAQLYRLMTAGAFPRPVQLGPGSVAWVEAEIEDWIAARVAERDRTSEPTTAALAATISSG